MKRAAFLACAGTDAPRFKLLKSREQLPFTPKLGPRLEDQEAELAHADYSLFNAFQMRVFFDASDNKGISIDAAQYIARNCARHLWDSSERNKSTGDMWIFYAQGRPYRFPDTGEYMTPRTLGAGTLDELASFIETKISLAETQFITLINASMVSDHVLAAAFKAGVIVGGDEPIKHVWEREYVTIDHPGEA